MSCLLQTLFRKASLTTSGNEVGDNRDLRRSTKLSQIPRYRHDSNSDASNTTAAAAEATFLLYNSTSSFVVFWLCPLILNNTAARHTYLGQGVFQGSVNLQVKQGLLPQQLYALHFSRYDMNRVGQDCWTWTVWRIWGITNQYWSTFRQSIHRCNNICRQGHPSRQGSSRSRSRSFVIQVQKMHRRCCQWKLVSNSRSISPHILHKTVASGWA